MMESLKGRVPMKPLTITVPSAQERVAVFTADERMQPIGSGRKIRAVLRKARKKLGNKEPLVVIVPKKNVTHIF